MKSKCCNADTSVDVLMSYDIRRDNPEKEVSREYRCLKCSKACEVLDNAPVEEKEIKIGHSHCKCMNLGGQCPNLHYATCSICIKDPQHPNHKKSEEETPEWEPKSLYKGKPITEMTREELVEALETMGFLYQQIIQNK